MAERVDAHIHLFEHGYRESFTARPGVAVDEVACYQSLMQDHGVKMALLVGYAAEDWNRDNNAFIAGVAREHDWAKPVAYVDATRPLTTDLLRKLELQGFVGISLYVFDEPQQCGCAAIAGDVWAWLVERHWLVSVNSRGNHWRLWRPILEQFGSLRLLVSHLGLPPRITTPPHDPEALSDVLALARHPGPRVKLSGFYALTDPGHNYPHTAAQPYARALAEVFGVERLLWGSDFSPCLDWVTFPQTLDVLRHMDVFSDADRRAIEGENLSRLLEEIDVCA